MNRQNPLLINEEVWFNTALKNSWEFNDNAIQHNSKLTKSLEGIDLSINLGGSFYGSYTCLKTRLEILNISFLTKLDFESIIRVNSEVIEGLTMLNDAKIFYLGYKICLEVDGVLNNEDSLIILMQLGELIVDLISNIHVLSKNQKMNLKF